MKCKGQVKFRICQGYTKSCKLNDQFLNSKKASGSEEMPITITKTTGNIDAHMTHTTKKDIDENSF